MNIIPYVLLDGACQTPAIHSLCTVNAVILACIQLVAGL